MSIYTLFACAFNLYWFTKSFNFGGNLVRIRRMDPPTIAYWPACASRHKRLHGASSHSSCRRSILPIQHVFSWRWSTTLPHAKSALYAPSARLEQRFLLRVLLEPLIQRQCPLHAVRRV